MDLAAEEIPHPGYLRPMAHCTSCGRDDEDTVAVHRVYLVLPPGAPADPDAIEDTAEPVIDADDEQWCASCRDHFPHVVVGPA